MGLAKRVAMFLIGAAYGVVVLLQLCWTLVVSKGAALKKKDRTSEPAVLTDPANGEHVFVRANGLRFHCVVNGKRDGPLMLCLHGFPQFWYTWRHVLKDFKADYRVVAVDMRGYGDSDKPSELSAYNGVELAKDISELVKALGHESCTLVAHDWGGAVAWVAAHTYPKQIDNLIIMNCAHPLGFVKNISLTQFFMSWYIFFFQLPVLPEIMMGLNDYAAIALGLLGKKMGVKDRTYVSKDDVEVYKYAIAKPHALTSALNYYRNVYDLPPLPTRVIQCPTLLLWGEEDKALSKSLNKGLEKYVKTLTIKYFPGVSHWLHEEKPNEVHAAMREFLATAIKDE